MCELKRYRVNYDYQYGVGIRDKRTVTNQDMFIDARSVDEAHTFIKHHVRSLYKNAYIIINSCGEIEK